MDGKTYIDNSIYYVCPECGRVVRGEDGACWAPNIDCFHGYVYQMIRVTDELTIKIIKRYAEDR